MKFRVALGSTPKTILRSLFRGSLFSLLLFQFPSSTEAQPLDGTNLDFEGARGHITNNAFFSGTEIDSVNTRTGNLVVKIPLGQRYKVGPRFEYGLDLACNSNAWDGVTTMSGTGSALDYTAPNYGTNAGPGCRVSLGMLYPSTIQFTGEPANWPNKSNSPWLWEAPDGSKIYFDCRGGCSGLNGTFYSNNGTFLRLKVSTRTSSATLEFPNGDKHTFQQTSFACAAGQCWRPKRMEDIFGNGVTVGYTDSPSAPKWLLTDTDGRYTEVGFLRGAASTGSTSELGDLKMIVDSIDFPAFGGNRALYRFNYEEHTIVRSCPIPDTATLPISIPVLTSIDLPEAGYGYRFSHHLPGPVGPGGCSRLSGLIKTIDFPTDARVAYEYGNYFSPSICSFPPSQTGEVPSDLIQSIGVRKREVYKNLNDGNPLTWEEFNQTIEERSFPPLNERPGECNRDNLTVTTVTSHPAINGKTKMVKNYHTVTRQEDDVPDTGPWAPEYFGLPITLNTSLAITTDFGSTAYLSKETSSCGSNGCEVLRRTYLKYAILPRSCSPWLNDPSCFRDEAVVQERRETYGLKHIDTQFSQYDGYGHFKIEKTKSDMPQSSTKVALTNYILNPNHLDIDPAGVILDDLPLPGTSAPWLLNRFDMTYEQLDGRREVREFETDPATGFRSCERRRYLINASDTTNSRSSNDLATRYFPSTDGRGFVASQRTAGGDNQAITTAAMCPSTGFEYRIDHQYQYSQRRHSQWRQEGGSAVGPPSLDLTIDLNSGMPASSRDHGASPALETTFDYDLLARKVLEETKASTSIDYTLNGAGAIVDVETDSSSGQLLSDFEFTLDELGRETRMRARTESGQVRQDKLYYPQGFLLRETTVQPESSFDGNHRRRFLAYDIFGRVGWIDDSNLGTGAQTRISNFGGSIHRRAERRYAKFDGSLGWLRRETRTDAYGRQTTESVGEFPQGSQPYRIKDTTYSGNKTVEKLRNPANSQSQQRTLWTDGRGFRYKESIPEKDLDLVYRYDSQGNLTSRKDGGISTTFNYDAAGRLQTVKQGSALLKKFSYNAQGKVWKATRYNHYTSANTFGLSESFGSLGPNITLGVEDIYTYNDLGLPATKNTRVFIDGNGDLRRAQQSWQYDDLGRVTETSYPNCTFGCETGIPREVHRDYRFGSLDRIRMGTGSNPPVLVEQDFHANGVPRKLSFFRNGALETYDEIETESNGLPRIKNIRIHNAAGSQLVTTGTYFYDLLGKIERITSPSSTLAYNYDPVHRLKSVTNGGNTQHSYQYDIFDNLLRLDDGSTVSVNASNNRLLSGGGGAATYDSRGRMTSWGLNNMSWDDLGFQLAWSSDRPFPHNDWLYQAVYVYDASDQRVMVFDRTREPNPPGPYGNNYASQIFTARDIDGKALRDFRKLPSPQGGVMHEYKDYVWAGQDLRAVDDNGSLKFAHLDHLGSVRVLSSGSSGFQLTGESFTPFGTKYVRSSHQRIGFSGHELNRNFPTNSPVDQEKDGLGLSYNMGAREYLPSLGRFASVDPGRDGWNLYAYAANDPINRIDPDGMRSESVESDTSLLSQVERTIIENRENLETAAQTVAGALTLAGAGATLAAEGAAGTATVAVAIAEAEGAALTAIAAETFSSSTVVGEALAASAEVATAQQALNTGAQTAVRTLATATRVARGATFAGAAILIGTTAGNAVINHFADGQVAATQAAIRGDDRSRSANVRHRMEVAKRQARAAQGQ